MREGGAVGIDVLSIPRLERALAKRPGLAGRLFTAAELDACSARARPGRHLAARFCAKEAAIKALQLERASIGDFEVEGGGTTAPRLRLTGRALERADRLGVGIEISISHDRDLAAAVAVTVPR